MADPTLLICVGATEAGTSWMYRYLHDREECFARSVKECHYFSTFKTKKVMRKLKILNRLLVQYEARLINATSARQIKPAHVGVAAPFPEGLRRDTLQFLKAQYDFVADNFADLPENWWKNRGLLA
jgi:hypothetical protein